MAVLPVPIRSQVVVRHIGARVADIAGSVSRSYGWNAVAPRRIQPVVVTISACGRRLVIGGLVPFVLCRDEVLCSCASGFCQAVADGVYAILGRAGVLRPG